MARVKHASSSRARRAAADSVHRKTPPAHATAQELLIGSATSSSSSSSSTGTGSPRRAVSLGRVVLLTALVLGMALGPVLVRAQDSGTGDGDSAPPKDPPPQSWQDVQYYLGAIWLGVNSPVWVVGVVLYFMQRDKQPIKAHSPNLVLTTDFVLISWQILICARGVVGNEYPCWIAMWADWACELGMASAYCMRAWVLYFRHELTYEMLQTSRESVKARLSIHTKPASVGAPGSGSAGSAGSSALAVSVAAAQPARGWFTAHKSLKTRAVLVPFFLALSAVLMIPAAVHTGSNKFSADTGATFTASTGWNCDNGSSTVILTIYNAFFIIIFAVMAYHLRLVTDGFGIKVDLRLTGVSAAITAVVWLIFKVVLTKVNNEKFPFSTLVALMFAQTAFCSHTFYPVWRTFYRPPVVDAGGAIGQDINSLRGILNAPDSFAVFQKFLSQEFCVENLLFWNDVEQFKSPETSMADEGTVWKLGRDIFAKYIRPGASLEVNIPSELRNDIIDYFNKNGPTGADKPKVNGVAGTFVTPATPGGTPSPLVAAADAFDQKDSAAGNGNGNGSGSGSGSGNGNGAANDSSPPPPPPLNAEMRRSALGIDAAGPDFQTAANAAVAASRGPRQSSKHHASLINIELTEKSPDGPASPRGPVSPTAQAQGHSPLLGAAGAGSDVAGAAAAAAGAPAFIVNIEPYACQKVFNTAQENIFALMESDPYQRFKYSDLYKEMVAKHEMEHRKHSALQLVKMA